MTELAVYGRMSRISSHFSVRDKAKDLLWAFRDGYLSFFSPLYTFADCLCFG